MAQHPPYVAGTFFQANTVKGYEAWDKAGAVANELSARFQTISYGPLGVVCESPVDPKDYLLHVRVNVQHILLAFRPGIRLDTVQREAAHRVEWIAQAINVAQFSRLGFRTMLVWGRESLEQAGAEIRDRFLPGPAQSWGDLGAVEPGELILNLAADDLVARVVLQPTQRTAQAGGGAGPSVGEEDSGAPPFGILLDVDIAKNGKTYYMDLQSYFRRCDRLLSERIIPHIERQLGGADT